MLGIWSASSLKINLISMRARFAPMQQCVPTPSTFCFDGRRSVPRGGLVHVEEDDVRTLTGEQTGDRGADA